MPNIEIVCVGTELLAGKVNTHTSYVGERLAEIGLRLRREHTVGDDRSVMLETFREAYRRADVVICCGGLGPTFDDITREAWAKVLKRRLRLQPKIVNDIREKFHKRDLSMPPMNRRQGYVLDGAKLVPNANGTAPGQFLETEKKILVLLPGPARELYPMFQSEVLPRLKDRFTRRFLRMKTLLIAGVPESRVDQIIRPFVNRYRRLLGCSVTHGILASQAIISVKFMVEGISGETVRRASDLLTKKARALLGKWVFGEDNDTLASVVGKLLQSSRRTLAVAESCTGGLVSKIITDIPGSSLYFREGVVTYSNEAKQRRVGVSADTLRRHGAVSAATARAMVLGLKSRAKVDVALSITGIAGPDGGTPEKPVGLVFIGIAAERKTRVFEFRFTGDRAAVRLRAALTSLDLVRRALLR